MHILQKMRISPEKLSTITERSFLILFAFFLLWKGGKGLDATWLLTALAWLCTYHYWKTKPRNNAHPPFWLWILPISFLLWTAISFSQTATGNYGLDEILRTGSLIAIFFWIGRLATQETEARQQFFKQILSIFIYTTLIACVIGVFIYILQPSSRFVGTFFDFKSHKAYWPNAWAEYLLLSWPLVFWWSYENMQNAQKRIFFLKPNIVHILLLGTLFAGMFLSYSRGAMIALGGQLLLWGLLLLKKQKKDWISYLPDIRKGACILFIAICFFLGANTMRSQFYNVESAAEKVTFTASEGKSSISERSQFWNHSAQLALQKPVFGWGAYSFRFLQPRFQTDVLATSDHPHNVFLKLAMERGIISAFLFAIFLCGILLPVYWKWEGKTDVHIQGANIVPALMVSVVGVLSHNLIDYNLQFVGIALPFWLMLGLLSSVLYKTESTTTLRKIFLSTEVGLCTILLVIAISETPYMITTSIGRHAEDRGDSSTAQRWYEISKKQRFSRDLHLSRAIIFLKKENIEGANEALNMYFAQNGEDARAWKLRGDVCTLQRDWDCAFAEYEKAYQLGKYNDASILHALVSTMKSARKIETLQQRRYEFDSLLNDFGLAIAMNSHFVALTPNVQEIVLLTRIFEKLYPENEPQYAALGAEVMRKAALEQERLNEDVSGYLW